MLEIRAKTTFYNSSFGRVKTGETVEVEDDLAEQLVDEKEYAEYVSEYEPVNIGGDTYPKEFVEMELPEEFPHHSIIAEQIAIPTFGNLIELESISDYIKDVGDNREKEIEEGIEKALDAFGN